MAKMLRKISIKKILGFAVVSCLAVLPLVAVGAGVELQDPLGLPKGDAALTGLAGRFIQAALGISGVLALIAFVYGGVLYLLAGVNPKNVEKGKEMMKYAVIGLFIIFSSYAIVTFLLENVFQVPKS